MKKTTVLLPLAYSISVLFGHAGLARADEQALRVEPVMSIKHSEPDAQALYKIGRHHQENNRLDLAGDAFRQILAVDAANADARTALASVYSQQNRFDEAIAELRMVLQANPKLAYAYNNLGYTYILKTDYLNAISALGNALALDPGNARAFGNLELAHARLTEAGNVRPATAATTVTAPAAETPATVPTVATAVQPEQVVQAVRSETAPAAAETTQTAEAAPVAPSTPAAAAPTDLNGLVIEISNGTRDEKLGESLAAALRQEGVTVTRVSGLKPYTQRRNVILYRDGYYKQALALSRSFTIPPALVNNTRGRDASDQSDVRLVLGKNALPEANAAGKAAADPAF